MAHYFGRFGSRIRLGALRAGAGCLCAIIQIVARLTAPPATEGDNAATVLAISHYSRRRLAHLNLGADLLNLRCLVPSRRVRKPICRDRQHGYLRFNVVTFVTALTFLLQCHLTTLNFRMKDRHGSQCAGEHKWLSSF